MIPTLPTPVSLPQLYRSGDLSPNGAIPPLLTECHFFAIGDICEVSALRIFPRRGLGQSLQEYDFFTSSFPLSGRRSCCLLTLVDFPPPITGKVFCVGTGWFPPRLLGFRPRYLSSFQRHPFSLRVFFRETHGTFQLFLFSELPPPWCSFGVFPIPLSSPSRGCTLYHLRKTSCPAFASIAHFFSQGKIRPSIRTN